MTTSQPAVLPGGLHAGRSARTGVTRRTKAAVGYGATARLTAAVTGGWPDDGRRQNTRRRPPLAQM
jgi:hypothetical protein